MMTPEQALQLLDSAAAKYQGTRADHIALSEALQLFKRLILERQAAPPASVVELAEAPKWRSKRATQGNG